jgi:hypothetical protein
MDMIATTFDIALLRSRGGECIQGIALSFLIVRLTLEFSRDDASAVCAAV